MLHELSILLWFWQIMGLVASLYIYKFYNNYQIGCISCTFYVAGTILAWYATNPAYPPGTRYLILKAHWIETLVTLHTSDPQAFLAWSTTGRLLCFFGFFWEPGQEKNANSRHGSKVKRSNGEAEFERNSGRFDWQKTIRWLAGQRMKHYYSSLGGSSQWMQAVRNPYKHKPCSPLGSVPTTPVITTYVRPGMILQVSSLLLMVHLRQNPGDLDVHNIYEL